MKKIIIPPGVGKISRPLTAYFDAVLGRLCAYYFAIPDTKTIVPGDLDFRPVWKDKDFPDPVERKPHCPGDYYSPSRYMFDPTPSETGIKMGQMHGRALKQATEELFNSRKAGDWAKAPIAKAIYEANKHDGDLFARTLVGVMMGFLPPSWGSLIGIFDDWLSSGELWRVQNALLAAGFEQALASGKGAACIDIADATVILPMRRAMLRRPAPDFIWRTATRDCFISECGTVSEASPPTPYLQVKKGEVLALSIYAATLENLQNGSVDVFPIFGGNRKGSNPPTHACPAYEMAMGTLLGITTALLASTNIRTTSFPLVVELSRRI